MQLNDNKGLMPNEENMMPNALVQARIDSEIKDKASAVLESLGLTLSDVVRILLTRVANEGGLPAGFVSDSKAYDIWFKTKVRESLEDDSPGIPHEEVEAYFAKRREELLKR